MTLLEYINKREPQAYARAQYATCDRRALQIGAGLLRRQHHVDELRMRRGSPWLEATCQQMADAIERDPSGRLLAAPLLMESSINGTERTWLRWYVAHLISWLDGRKAPDLAPMMVE